MRFVSICMMIAATALLAVMLSGCTTTSGVTQYVTVDPTVPTTLHSCAAEPYVPAGATQKAAADYIVDLRASGADCRSKLGSLNTLLAKDAAPPLKRK